MYRDHLYAARCRREVLANEPRADGVDIAVVAVLARRAGRVSAGLFGISGAVLLVLSLAARGPLGLSTIVLYSWLAMAASYATTLLVVRLWVSWRVTRARRGTGDPLHDLCRLEAAHPRLDLLRSCARLEQASLALPLLAVSLLTPLSIHLCIAVGVMAVTLEGFSGWIALSLVLVGHAHITLAVFAIMHARSLKRELDANLPAGGASRGLVALVWTVGASAFPGMVLVCLPPLIVAATGALFVPLVFHWARQCALRERAVMQRAAL